MDVAEETLISKDKYLVKSLVKGTNSEKKVYLRLKLTFKEFTYDFFCFVLD